MNDEIQVCSDCVGDSFLAKKMSPKSELGQCAICEKMARVIDLSELAWIIDPRYREIVGFAEPIMRVGEGDDDRVYRDDGGQSAVDIMQELTGCDYDLAAALVEFLADEEGYAVFQGDTAYYGENEEYEIVIKAKYSTHRDWEKFKKSVMHEVRFFNSSAITFLTNVFCHALADFDPAPVVKLARGSRLFRARLLDDADIVDIACDPAGKLGSPPARLAKGGRMNPSGVSVFYASKSADTAIAEVRPWVGADVVLGQFETLRDVTLVDLSRFSTLRGKYEYFDAELEEKLGFESFLRDLHGEIQKPVRSQDHPLEFIPTQVIAEYLSELHVPKFDGLVYGSVQGEGGVNYVLFRHASAAIGTKFSKVDAELAEDRDFDDGRLDRVVVSATNAIVDHADGAIWVVEDEPTDAPTLSFVHGSLKKIRILGVEFQKFAVDVVVERKRERRDHEF